MLKLFWNELQFQYKNLPWRKAYICPMKQATDILMECLYGKSVSTSKFSLAKHAGCSVNLYGNRVYL